MTWPPHDERHTNASLVKAEFAAAQAAAAAAAKARQRAVIAGKDHQRLPFEAEFFQTRKQAAHLAVVFVKHSTELALFSRSVRVEAEAFLIGHPGRVHVIRPKVHKARLPPMDRK